MNLPAHKPGSLDGLDLLAAAVLLIDADGCITYANAAAENLLENSFKALQGTPLTSLFVNADELAKLCEQALAHKYSDLRQDLTLERGGRDPLHVHSIVSEAGEAGIVIELRENIQQLKLDREERILDPVSYTHLTLPTILLV